MIAGSLRSRISRVGIVGILVALAACGPTPAETQLNYASQQCSYYGDPDACNAVGPLSYQAQAERQQQDNNAALAAGLAAVGGIALGAALADNGGHRHYYHGGGWGHRGHW